jgi:BR serine/threonine kinase
VKAGICSMPAQAPPEVQDLIREMLCVDGEKRITIPGIKAHPAFRLFLPEGYQIPSPLPIPTLVNPIDPATVGEGVIAVLKSIGYRSDEEIHRELLAPTTSMAKVFCLMYTRSRSVEDYPWPETGSETASGEVGIDDVFLMPAEIIGTEGSVRNPFNKRSPMPGSLGPVRSLAAPAAWGNDPMPDIEPEEEQALTQICLPIEELMFALQGYLTERGIAWFHPNDRVFLGRTIDRAVYVEFEVTPCDPDQQDLCVRLLRGDAAEFEVLVDGVMDLVQRLLDSSGT